MSILIDSDTRVIIQGMGSTGRFHPDKAIAYGTQMVGAVHPSRAGTTEIFAGDTDHSGVPGRPDTYRVEPEGAGWRVLLGPAAVKDEREPRRQVRVLGRDHRGVPAAHGERRQRRRARRGGCPGRGRR